MGSRGRESAESLELNVVHVSGQRLGPPDDLDTNERLEWVEIVNSLPADYFRPADVSLLAAYCTARAFYKAAALEMKRDGIVLMDERGKRYSHPAHAILQSQASAMAQMAVKLRLCPSSRYSDKSAATKTDAGGMGKRPWDRVKEG